MIRVVYYIYNIIVFISPTVLLLLCTIFIFFLIFFTGERPRLHRVGKAASGGLVVRVASSSPTCDSGGPTRRRRRRRSRRGGEGRRVGGKVDQRAARRGSVSPAPAAQRPRGQCTGQWLPRARRALAPRHSHADGRVLLKWRIPIRDGQKISSPIGRRRG